MKKMCPLFGKFKFKFFAGVVSIILLISVQNTYGAVVTSDASGVGANSAILNGSCDFGAVSRGFEIEDAEKFSGGGEGQFFLEVLDLSPNTDYEYRAFAYPGNMICEYGGVVNFRTTPEPCIFGFLGLVFLFFRRK